MDHIAHRASDKVDKLCTAGLDPNFHDAHGETPLTVAAGLVGSRDTIVALVGGGAHLDFRNSEGQTAMHKAAFLGAIDNIRALLELGASPNYRDPIGLTPLYYAMLTADANADVAELLLKDCADIGVTDMHGNHEIHQVILTAKFKSRRYLFV
jgi:SH3/ankyrin repeat-containing protein